MMSWGTGCRRMTSSAAGGGTNKVYVLEDANNIEENTARDITKIKNQTTVFMIMIHMYAGERTETTSMVAKGSMDVESMTKDISRAAGSVLSMNTRMMSMVINSIFMMIMYYTLETMAPIWLILVQLSVHLIHDITQMDKTLLTFRSWNLNCNFPIARPYLDKLLETTNVLALSEHGLYPCELYKMNDINEGFSSLAKPSKKLINENFGKRRRHGGCAILWYKRLSNCIRPLPYLGTDRMCGIQISLPDTTKLYVISVYLPHQSCMISDFDEELASLENALNDCHGDGLAIVVGDTNVHLGPEYGTRGWGRTTRNGKKFANAMVRCRMNVTDISDKGNGPLHTYSSGTCSSYIDHICVSSDLYSNVTTCREVGDDIDNVSDHLPSQFPWDFIRCFRGPQVSILIVDVRWHGTASIRTIYSICILCR